MIEFISENWGTIVVGILLAVLITLAVVKLVKDKRTGKGSCCGDCSKCRNMGDNCRKH